MKTHDENNMQKQYSHAKPYIFACMEARGWVGATATSRRTKVKWLMTSPCWPRRGLLLTLSRRVAVQRPDARFGLSWEAWGGGRPRTRGPWVRTHWSGPWSSPVHTPEFGLLTG